MRAKKRPPHPREHVSVDGMQGPVAKLWMGPCGPGYSTRWGRRNEREVMIFGSTAKKENGVKKAPEVEAVLNFRGQICG